MDRSIDRSIDQLAEWMDGSISQSVSKSVSKSKGVLSELDRTIHKGLRACLRRLPYFLANPKKKRGHTRWPNPQIS